MSGDLRPLTLGELLDRGFFLYRKNFLLFVGIVAAPQLAVLAFQLAGVAIGRGAGAASWGLLWTFATVIISLAAGAAAQGATVVAVSRVHLGRSTSIAEAFAGIKGRIVHLLLITIGLTLGVGVGFLLLVVPGVILALMWALTIPVAVIENKGLRESVSRSAMLTKGHRGRVFVVVFLFLVILWAVYAAWEIPVGVLLMLAVRGHAGAGVPIWTQLAIPMGSFLSQCLVGPLMTIGLSLLYYDERVRKEAFDLQHMMTTLDTPQSGTISTASA